MRLFNLKDFNYSPLISQIITSICNRITTGNINNFNIENSSDFLEVPKIIGIDFYQNTASSTNPVFF